MFEVRIHGRGGQGVVTAAELLSLAAFREGRHAQAFPSFGSERMGAPVVVLLPHLTSRRSVPASRSPGHTRCRPGRHPAAPGRPVRRPARRRVRADQLHPRSGRARPRGVDRRLSPRAADDGARGGDLPRAPRPDAAQCGDARSARGPHPGRLPRGRRAGDRRALRRPSSPSGTSRPRERASSTCWRRCRRPSVLEQLEGSRAVARAVALCRPEVIPAYPISPQTHIVERSRRWSGTASSPRASSSTWSRSSPRCRSRSAPAPPGRAPTRRPPARGCCTWSRRSTTPPASGSRS